jgi:2-oxoglutarate ferredoxin oxidoreductase subunit alpha
MERVINDFTINIATANGTGSQSANLILLQSLFDMGVPVSGKNLFPSNISGLPTWYIVRLSDRGYQAPGDRTHIQVLVNPATWEEDLAALEPGSVVIWNSDTKKKTVDRDDIVSYPVPMSSLARKINPKIAKLVTNIVYVGVLAELLGIDQTCLESAVAKQFKGKATAVELNITALGLGRDYCKENFTKQDPFTVESREVEKPQFFIEGNEAAALGAHYGGVQLLAWYPITPSSSLAEGIINCSRDSGRGRIGRCGHGARCRMGRRPRNDRHLRTGYFPHAGIHWTGLLCRNPLRLLGRHSCGTFHGPSNSNTTI